MKNFLFRETKDSIPKKQIKNYYFSNGLIIEILPNGQHAIVVDDSLGKTIQLLIDELFFC